MRLHPALPPLWEGDCIPLGWGIIIINPVIKQFLIRVNWCHPWEGLVVYQDQVDEVGW